MRIRNGIFRPFQFQGGVVWLDLGLASSAVTQITCVFYEKKGAQQREPADSVSLFCNGIRQSFDRSHIPGDNDQA